MAPSLAATATPRDAACFAFCLSARSPPFAQFLAKPEMAGGLWSSRRRHGQMSDEQCHVLASSGYRDLRLRAECKAIIASGVHSMTVTSGNSPPPIALRTLSFRSVAGRPSGGEIQVGEKV